MAAVERIELRKTTQYLLRTRIPGTTRWNTRYHVQAGLDVVCGADVREWTLEAACETRTRPTDIGSQACLHASRHHYLVGAREVSERASAAESGVESKTGVSRPLEDGISACACGHLRREYAALQELFHPMSPPNMRILAAHTSSRQTTLRPATVRWLRRSIVRGFGRAPATLDMYSYVCRIYSWASRRNECSACPATARAPGEACMPSPQFT